MSGLQEASFIDDVTEIQEASCINKVIEIQDQTWAVVERWWSHYAFSEESADRIFCEQMQGYRN